MPLAEHDSGVGRAIARLHNSRIDATKTDAARFHRREALLIRNRPNGAMTLRFAFGAGVGIRGLTRSAIAIDYDARDALGVDESQLGGGLDLEVRKASWAEVYRFFLNHQDPGYRTATQLGVIGAALGALSVIITVVQLAL